MASLPDNWRREHFEPGGGDAWLMYVVFGDFPEQLPACSASKYRTGGEVDVDLRLYHRDTHADWIAGWIDWHPGRELAGEDPELYEAIAAAPSCMVVQLEVGDPDNLEYLRSAIGWVTFVAELGGVAILDPQVLRYWRPEVWRSEVFDPDDPQPLRHVVTMISAQDDSEGGLSWVHTRGMRKFGRPDLSVHDVTRELQPDVVELVERFMVLQARGGSISDGAEVRMKALPEAMRCEHRGDVEDPDFNNVHVEIGWPSH